MPTGVKGLLFGPVSQTKPPAPAAPAGRAFLLLPHVPGALLTGVGGGLGNLGLEQAGKCPRGPGTEPWGFRGAGGSPGEQGVWRAGLTPRVHTGMDGNARGRTGLGRKVPGPFWKQIRPSRGSLWETQRWVPHSGQDPR